MDRKCWFPTTYSHLDYVINNEFSGFPLWFFSSWKVRNFLHRSKPKLSKTKAITNFSISHSPNLSRSVKGPFSLGRQQARLDLKGDKGVTHTSQNWKLKSENYFLLKTNLETFHLSLQNKYGNFQVKVVLEWIKATFILEDFLNSNFREQNRLVKL